MAVTFESYERRIDQIKPVMEKYGIKDFEDSLKICTDKGFNPYEIVKGVQPICFENAAWAYTLGAAIAIKKGCKKASDAFVHPFFIAIAAPKVYAQAAFSKQIGCTPLTISYGLNPLSVHIFNASSKSLIPYFSITGFI